METTTLFEQIVRGEGDYAFLQAWHGKVETDARGNIILSPPPSYRHGRRSVSVVLLLRQHLPDWEITSEIAVLTPAGGKGPDVTAASPERYAEIKDDTAAHRAPEIVVEVLSPSNALEEMEKKATAYFEAGALEVWLVLWETGDVRFYHAGEEGPRDASRLAPAFPTRIDP